MVHPASVHGQAAVGTDALAGDVPARVGGKQEGAATACSTVAPAARAPRTSRPTAASMPESAAGAASAARALAGPTMPRWYSWSRIPVVAGSTRGSRFTRTGRGACSYEDV